VSITGHNKARAVAIFEKVKAAGAKTIGVGVDDWSEIYHA
jgi:hydroxylamine reductase (hybrid-cluster protein)